MRSPIRRGFAPGFVNYKKWCTRLAAASDKIYQLLAHGRWFSTGTPASSTTKTGRHDIAESGITTPKIKSNPHNMIQLYNTGVFLNLQYDRIRTSLPEPFKLFVGCSSFAWF
jgi:hypothetical protein